MNHRSRLIYAHVRSARTCRDRSDRLTPRPILSLHCQRRQRPSPLSTYIDDAWLFWNINVSLVDPETTPRRCLYVRICVAAYICTYNLPMGEVRRRGETERNETKRIDSRLEFRKQDSIAGYSRFWVRSSSRNECRRWRRVVGNSGNRVRLDTNRSTRKFTRRRINVDSSNGLSSRSARITSTTEYVDVPTILPPSLRRLWLRLHLACLSFPFVSFRLFSTLPSE